MPRMPPPLLIALLAVAAVIAIVASLALGSAGLDAPWAGLAAGDPLTRTIVLELRLPRALAAFGTGIVLALAGVLMQALLRNPLADPYVLGISGGAAVGALGVMLAGLAGLAVNAGAAAGAFAAMLLVFAVAHGPGGWTTTRLLLTGVVVAAGCGAIVSLLLSLSDDLRLRGMLFWLLGDFGYVRTPWSLLALALFAIPACLLAARPLDVLARGELQARLLGVPVRGLRIGIYVAASVLTAAAVTTAGSIGFVGLVTPHLVRLIVGSAHRAVIPAAALAGGTLLVVADLLARTIVAPRQLPVGALTALLGVPLFLLLMRRQPAA
ncbi:MAG: iron ABC transporter permease [Gammaproteobacteria bacterium]|nr:MAG: iron ABC transporter permease [Gammaproteobacteria bacterium]